MEEQNQSNSNQNADNAAPAPYNPLHVQLPVYEGPLDLLLDLIKKNEMDIYNIPISEITGHYLNYLHHMKELNLEIAGEFLVMAATLIYIKSKMLLPALEDENEEDGGEDPRAELVRKLLEYQAFKEAAKELGMLESERGKVFTRQISDYYLSNLSGEEVEIDTFSANLYDLFQAFHSVLKNAARDNFHEVFEEVISIEEKTSQIKERLSAAGTLLFTELIHRDATRNELIVTFLALLEIIRSKFARVEQGKHFEAIRIIKISSADAVSGLMSDEGQGNAE